MIATSSSDEKLAQARKLGADETINYRTTPDWDKVVPRLCTGGQGVDQVIEVSAGTGKIRKTPPALDGLLWPSSACSPLAAGLDPLRVLMKSIRVQGVFVGSRSMFEEMNQAISVNQLKPVIDRTFPFDHAREALEAMKTGSHFGKIVLKF